MASSGSGGIEWVTKQELAEQVKDFEERFGVYENQKQFVQDEVNRQIVTKITEQDEKLRVLSGDIWESHKNELMGMKGSVIQEFD